MQTVTLFVVAKDTSIFLQRGDETKAIAHRMAKEIGFRFKAQVAGTKKFVLSDPRWPGVFVTVKADQFAAVEQEIPAAVANLAMPKPAVQEAAPAVTQDACVCRKCKGSGVYGLTGKYQCYSCRGTGKQTPEDVARDSKYVKPVADEYTRNDSDNDYLATQMEADACVA